MLRLIIDTGAGRHKDLFLIIDSKPWHLTIADSYFLFDFLEINMDKQPYLNCCEKDVLKLGAFELLDYWLVRIKSIQKGQTKFIPFDFSDQYLGGLLFEKVKNNFKIRLVCTDRISGFQVSISNLDNMLLSNKIEFESSEKSEWLMSEEGVYNGLEYSKEEINKFDKTLLNNE